MRGKLARNLSRLHVPKAHVLLCVAPLCKRLKEEPLAKRRNTRQMETARFPFLPEDPKRQDQLHDIHRRQSTCRRRKRSVPIPRWRIGPGCREHRYDTCPINIAIPINADRPREWPHEYPGVLAPCPSCPCSERFAPDSYRQRKLASGLQETALQLFGVPLLLRLAIGSALLQRRRPADKPSSFQGTAMSRFLTQLQARRQKRRLPPANSSRFRRTSLRKR